MTLYLPYNVPRSQVVCNYIFHHNTTHSGLVIDYGSLLNHHESANVKSESIEEESGPNIHFQVRRGFQCVNRNVLKISMHAQIHIDVRTHKLLRPQKTSRLDRKFLFRMALPIGLNLKMYRTLMLTTRAQCGGRTFIHSHVAKAFVTQLERMANPFSPL